MVKVLILGPTLQQRVTEPELDLDLDGPVAIKNLIEGNADLLDALAPFVVRGELLVTVNRKVGSLDSIVKDGDVLKIAINHAPPTTAPLIFPPDPALPGACPFRWRACGHPATLAPQNRPAKVEDRRWRATIRRCVC